MLKVPVYRNSSPYYGTTGLRRCGANDREPISIHLTPFWDY